MLLRRVHDYGNIVIVLQLPFSKEQADTTINQ